MDKYTKITHDATGIHIDETPTGRHANIGNYLTDKEKIARAEGMMELGKALCMNGTVVAKDDAPRMCTILQVVIDAVLCTLKSED